MNTQKKTPGEKSQKRLLETARSGKGLMPRSGQAGGNPLFPGYAAGGGIGGMTSTDTWNAGMGQEDPMIAAAHLRNRIQGMPGGSRAERGAMAKVGLAPGQPSWSPANAGLMDKLEGASQAAIAQQQAANPIAQTTQANLALGGIAGTGPRPWAPLNLNNELGLSEQPVYQDYATRMPEGGLGSMRAGMGPLGSDPLHFAKGGPIPSLVPPGAVWDGRSGGEVPPGPEGVDTVPAVTQAGPVMLDSNVGEGRQEYVLTPEMVEALGGSGELDVLRMALGGAAGMEVECGEDGMACGGGRKVKKMAEGGKRPLPVPVEDRYNLHRWADQAQMLKEQESGLPGTPEATPIGILPAAFGNMLAARDYRNKQFFPEVGGSLVPPTAEQQKLAGATASAPSPAAQPTVAANNADLSALAPKPGTTAQTGAVALPSGSGPAPGYVRTPTGYKAMQGGKGGSFEYVGPAQSNPRSATQDEILQQGLVPAGARIIASGGVRGIGDGSSPLGFSKAEMDTINANMRNGGGGGFFGIVGGAPAGVDQETYDKMTPAQKSAAKTASIERATAAVHDLRNAKREIDRIAPAEGWVKYAADQKQAVEGQKLAAGLREAQIKGQYDVAAAGARVKADSEKVTEESNPFDPAGPPIIKRTVTRNGPVGEEGLMPAGAAPTPAPASKIKLTPKQQHYWSQYEAETNPAKKAAMKEELLKMFPELASAFSS